MEENYAYPDVTDVSTDFIASVTQTEAEEFARNVLNGKRQQGYYKNYRFQIFTEENDNIVIFLNTTMELHSAWNVLLISGLVGMVCFLAVFFLVILLSQKAMKPYIRNIERQKRFITDASHELKTPLTIIDANTEVMEMENGESQWTKSTRKQIQRLSGLVQQLVTLSRLDEEKGLQNPAEFNLSEAVSESVESYEALAQTKEKNLELEIEKNIFYVGDEKSIRQLFGILMDNAVKYSSDKGNIKLTLKRKGRKILLEVYNDAEELPKGKLDVLFERFYRLDSSRNSGTGGSGIGLSVAKAIVLTHKGKITAENRKGNGLTVTVLL